VKRILVVVLSSLMLGCIPAVAQASEAGYARLFLDLKLESNWEEVSKNLTKEQAVAHFKAHFSVIERGFPCKPSTGKYTSDEWIEASGVPLITYQDSSTDECGAAPLNAERRKTYIENLENAMTNGASGIFMDDMNFSCAYRDGEQEKGTTCESHPGKEAKEDGELVKEIHTKYPSAIIDINTHFGDIQNAEASSNTELKEGWKTARENATLIHQEFGVGATSEITTLKKYEEYIAFVKEMHAKEKHVVLGGEYHSESTENAEYELATFYVFNNGGDYLDWRSDKLDTPKKMWKGYCASPKVAEEKGECPTTMGDLELGPADSTHKEAIRIGGEKDYERLFTPSGHEGYDDAAITLPPEGENISLEHFLTGPEHYTWWTSTICPKPNTSVTLKPTSGCAWHG
jgi:hypothetical protein